MKVISLLQPWASLCLTLDQKGKALKQIETRSWNTKYRGELLIHSSAKKIRLQDGMYDLIDHMERIGFMKEYDKLQYGAIIGKVNLVTSSILCPPYSDPVGPFGIYFNDKGAAFTEQEMAFGNYEAGRYGWLFSDPILFKEPIPCKGQLSIWNLPTELEASVRMQVGKSISHEQALNIYRRNVWPKDENGNHIEMSEEERLERINRFRCQGYF